MLGQTEDDRQLVVAPGSGDWMHYPGHTLVPVVGLTRARGKHPILEEKGLIPREALFEEMSFSGLILSTETILVEDGIELLLCLRSDIIM